jgi:preprotein translocase subunit SecE
MTNPIQFLKEVRAELTKVVWPSRKDVVKITITVIIFSLATAAILGGADYVLTTLLEKLVNR